MSNIDLEGHDGAQVLTSMEGGFSFGTLARQRARARLAALTVNQW